MNQKAKMTAACTAALTAGVIFGLAAAQSARAAEDDPPLSLARDGFFYVGGKNTTVDGRTHVVGQMYVEMRMPAKQTHPFPIIMVHGGTRTGATYTGTPDGRESWAQYFARRGYAVYVVDQPGRGRSGYLTEAYGPQTLADGESGQRRYLQQEKFKLWPQAHLHTQWPGNGAPDDPVTLQMVGSYVPEIKDFTKQQFLNRDALVALLERIGPSIILVHSQAGAFAWPVADARPELVKAIVGVEPNGPPVHSVELVGAALWDYGRSAELCPRRQGRIRARLREGGQGRCVRSGDLLEAGGTGTAASQSAEDADHGDDFRGVLSRPLRSLHREVPAAGRHQGRLDQARRPRHQGQQPRHDAGEEQQGDRGGDLPMARQGAAGSESLPLKGGGWRRRRRLGVPPPGGLGVCCVTPTRPAPISGLPEIGTI